MPHIGYVSRSETFSAAHRLHSPHLSDEENKAVYGRCNHPSGHGHNYTVTVVMKGPIDPSTGMILNLTILKACMVKAVLEPLDHRNIDMDVPHFAHHPSTAENIAIFVWEVISHHMPSLYHGEAVLHEVRIQETPGNIAYYRGEVSSSE